METSSIAVRKDETVEQIVSASDGDHDYLFLRTRPPALYVVSDPFAPQSRALKISENLSNLINVLPFGDHLVTVHSNGLLRLCAYKCDGPGRVGEITSQLGPPVNELRVPFHITACCAAGEDALLVGSGGGQLTKVSLLRKKKRMTTAKLLPIFAASGASGAREPLKLVEDWSYYISSEKEVRRVARIHAIVADAMTFVASTHNVLHTGICVDGTVTEDAKIPFRSETRCYARFADTVFVAGKTAGYSAAGAPPMPTHVRLAVYQLRDRSQGFKLISERMIAGPKRVIDICVSNNGAYLFVSDFSKKVYLYDVANGSVVDSIATTDRVQKICIFCGHLAVTFRDKLSLVELPDKIRELTDSPVTDPSVLERRIMEKQHRLVMAGEKTPGDVVHLITRPRCEAALSEWHAAHEILMLAVEDGTVASVPHHDGVDSWWLQQLYAPVCFFQYESDAHRQAMIAHVREAERSKVLESAAALIGDMCVAQHVTAEIRELHKAGIMMWRRLLENERELEQLTATLQRYNESRRNSLLLSIAVQLIPIAGGSLAALLSAGAEIAPEFTVKDVTDYVLGFAVSVGPDAVSSTRGRMLRSARVAVSDESLESMDSEKRRRLLDAIGKSGLSLTVLREMLDERFGELQETNKLAENASSKVDDVTIAEAINGPDVDEDVSGSTEEGDRNGENRDIPLPASESGGGERGGGDEWGDLKSRFEGSEISSNTVLGLNVAGVAAVWAIFTLSFKDEHKARFPALRETLENFLGQAELDSAALSQLESSGMRQEVCDKAVKFAEGALGEQFSLGSKHRLRRFLVLLG